MLTNRLRVFIPVKGEPVLQQLTSDAGWIPVPLVKESDLLKQKTAKPVPTRMVMGHPVAIPRSVAPAAEKEED
jgi:hypothetical protein